jgi:PIN domain nuclease of toxin-antitoxin system
MIYILDACALIALLNEEPGADVVQNFITEAIDGKISLHMSIVNIIEVHYGFYNDFGKEVSDAILERVYKMPIQFHRTIDAKVSSEAARLKGTYGMSLGDAIGLATAISLDGLFVSSDSELKEPVALENAPVLWFRPPKEKKPPRHTPRGLGEQ